MIFSEKLNLWYKNNQRDFPWRNTKNPYFIWLSEIILQQTKVAQGLPYYIAFVNKYATVYDLAKAKESEVLKLWQGLGYYSRARNLHFTAKDIVNNYNGIFPTNYKTLLQLKGVGDYTASAIASICYDEKSAVVDGNVYRVLARYFGIFTAINSSAGIKEFKTLAQKLLPLQNIGNYNQAIMDFGATICTPKKPKCDTCIFNDSCVALQKKKVLVLPVKPNKIKIKKRYFNYLVVLDKNNNALINKRTKKDIWLNLYEFPLIEVDKIVTKKELVKQDLFNKVTQNNKCEVVLFNTKIIVHKLSHQHIYTNFWIIKIEALLVKSIPFNDINIKPVSTLIHNFMKEFEL